MTTVRTNDEKKECHKIEELPKQYQAQVNAELLVKTVGGYKGTSEEVKQRLVDKYYNQWQQEQKQENISKTANLNNIPLDQINGKMVLEHAVKMKKSNRKGFDMPPDVVAAQQGIKKMKEFIEQQMKEAKRDVNRKLKRHKSNPVPLSFYRRPMIDAAYNAPRKEPNNKIAKINQKSISNVKYKDALSAFF